jgi:alpha-glucoside transport system substrate-binding protein
MRLRHRVVQNLGAEKPGNRDGSRRRLGLLVPAVAIATVLAGCSNAPSTGTGPVPTLTGDCAKYQAFAGYAGTTVTMFASIISPESDSLQRSWSEFSQCTGISISYEGSNDFESQLPVRVSGGNAPDFAIIPQPGLLQKMVQTGKVVKAPAQTESNVDKYWTKDWKAYGTVEGTFYAAPMSSNMKSLVWYSPKAFTGAGYQVPTTWTDLMKLSDTIADAGEGRPWCGGIGSGTATGWPATDWLEQIVLRTGGGTTYDKWISHEIKFNSPEITAAMQIVADWMLNPKYVNGGFGDVKSIATTTFQDAGKPILTGQCWMLQQASFYGAQWPAGTTIAQDGDIYAFYLPGINSSVSTPVVGGGEFVTAFASRPEVQAVQTYLSTPEWHTSRVKAAKGWVSANQGTDQSAYTDPIDMLSAKYLTDPNATFRFDASDLMPPAVGAGQEWKSLTAWFAEGKSIQQVADEIDAAWPN